MDQTRFLAACRQVMESRQKDGIGTLGEKSLHAALKLYLEPRELHREVTVGRYIADIVNEQGILEIQTAGFDKLRNKLKFFLESSPVTIVYPSAGVKRLITVTEHGSVSRPRRSPKPGGPWDILPELYRIRPLLAHPGLSFCVPVLEVEEYRLKEGRSHRGYTRWERMPVRLLDEIWVKEKADLPGLLPAGLPEKFTAKDFYRLGRFSQMAGSMALLAARELGAITQIGTQGRAYVYQVCVPKS